MTCYVCGMRQCLVVLGTVLATLAGPTAQTNPSQFAAALQRKYDAVRDFQADFVQTVRGGVLRRRLTERGTVIVKKPSKMKWEYAFPEKKLFVSDGSKLYSYFPADKQVIVSEVAVDDQAASPGLFLAGHARLTEDFIASFVELPEDMPREGVALKLVPRVPRPDYEWLVLVADPDQLTLRGLLWADAQGGTSSFAFTNLKENLGPTDKEFVFTIPHGVEVVADSSVL